MPLETPRTYVNLVFEPDEDAPRRRPRRRHAPLIAGLVALAAVGAAAGFVLEPMFDDERPGSQIAAPVTETPAQADNLDIVVDPNPPPAAEPVAPEPEGILPPVETAAPAPVQREDDGPIIQTPPPKATEPVRSAPQVVRPAEASRPPPAPKVAEAPEVRPYTPTPPPTVRRASRTARPSFNCRYARTTSEQMICSDSALASADRRMVRAYQQAIRRGIPEPELRRQQDIWLGVRESAARYGPEGVARAYEQRTAELQRMGR